MRPIVFIELRNGAVTFPVFRGLQAPEFEGLTHLVWFTTILTLRTLQSVRKNSFYKTPECIHGALFTDAMYNYYSLLRMAHLFSSSLSLSKTNGHNQPF